MKIIGTKSLILILISLVLLSQVLSATKKNKRVKKRSHHKIDVAGYWQRFSTTLTDFFGFPSDTTIVNTEAENFSTKAIKEKEVAYEKFKAQHSNISNCKKIIMAYFLGTMRPKDLASEKVALAIKDFAADTGDEKKTCLEYHKSIMKTVVSYNIVVQEEISKESPKLQVIVDISIQDKLHAHFLKVDLPKFKGAPNYEEEMKVLTGEAKKTKKRFFRFAQRKHKRVHSHRRSSDIPESLKGKNLDALFYTNTFFKNIAEVATKASDLIKTPENAEKLVVEIMISLGNFDYISQNLRKSFYEKMQNKEDPKSSVAKKDAILNFFDSQVANEKLDDTADVSKYFEHLTSELKKKVTTFKQVHEDAKKIITGA
jgi:hypothetical protein